MWVYYKELKVLRDPGDLIPSGARHEFGARPGPDITIQKAHEDLSVSGLCWSSPAGLEPPRWSWPQQVKETTLLGVPAKAAGGETVQGRILIIISQNRISRASPGRCPSLGRRGGDPGADYLPTALVQGNLDTQGNF